MIKNELNDQLILKYIIFFPFLIHLIAINFFQQILREVMVNIQTYLILKIKFIFKVLLFISI